MESQGTTTYTMELGGLWLCGSLESDLGAQKYTGKSLDTYDAGKKKYVQVWVDSMSPQPMTFEGEFDREKKTLTLTADGHGPDGQATKWKSVSTYPDDDTIQFAMYVGAAKEPMFTVVYKRQK